MVKAAETAREPLSPFDALMEAAVDAIIIIDSNGHIERFNRAAESLFGGAADAAAP